MQKIVIRVTSQLRTEHLTQLFQIQSFLSKERIFRNGTREEFETENGWTTSISDQNWSTHERLKGQLVNTILMTVNGIEIIFL